MYLQNTLFKLVNRKELNVGFFGGSITEGASASDMNKTSWRALTVIELKKMFPSAEINEIQAAIGGTNSVYGMLRMDMHLLSKKPDLVFLEFAVNDFGLPEKDAFESYETCIRKIYEYNPECDIVIIYTTTKSIYEALSEKKQVYSLECEKKLAKYYDIPEINVGDEIVKKIKSGENTWEDLTTDNCHPNDVGYKLYADKVKGFLSEELSAAVPEKIVKKTIAPSYSNYYKAAKLYDCFEMKTDFEKVDSSLFGRYPHYIKSAKKDAIIEFEFVGEHLGILVKMAKDSGKIAYSIDNQPEKLFDTWDIYCPQFDRVNYLTLEKSLSNEKHTLNIRVSGEKSEKSLGSTVYIAAIGVASK